MPVELLATGTTSRDHVTGAIRRAADASGVSFQYLLAAAKIESDLNPQAAASTSSARGLYQFIEQTWLGTVKEAGNLFGLGRYADAITRTPDGAYAVGDAAAREQILKLRDDPAAASTMAGVLTQSNSFRLTGALGRRPTEGELYIAHFMGAGAAGQLISTAERNPSAPAAPMFPAAAAANTSIFYDRSGAPRSAAGVYLELTSRYARAVNAPTTRTALAAAGETPAAVARTADTAAYLATFPQVPTQPGQPLDIRTTSVASAGAAPPEPLFRSLFQAGERSEPLSSTVRDLWGDKAVSPASGSAAQPSPGGERRPLDLFSDRTGAYSG